jgi:hypothetical protein
MKFCFAKMFVFAKFTTKKLWRSFIKTVFHQKLSYSRKFSRNFRINFRFRKNFRIDFRENFRYFRNFLWGFFSQKAKQNFRKNTQTKMFVSTLSLCTLFQPSSSSYTYFSRDYVPLRLFANLFSLSWNSKMPEYRNDAEKFSPASLVLPLLRCVSPASAFRHLPQSGTAGHGLFR